MDLGSVSTGYSDRPWDPGKQLPLGLNLTGPAPLRQRVSSAIALELVRRKLQASSLTAGPGSCRMNLERNKYEIKSKF